MNEELTIERLRVMKPGIFASGFTVDSPEGVNMARTGKRLRWVAVCGHAEDWAIYVGLADEDRETVRDVGDKVTSESNLRKLVPCDDRAFKMYRY